jgi:hypothetical protein
MVYTEDADGGGEMVSPRHISPHYHGDSVRVMFFIGALVLVVAQSTGADLPLSTMGSIIAAVVLVIAAGITNPSQKGIHWFNAGLSVIGTIIFATAAVSRYRAGISVFDPSFTYLEALALLSLVALYFTTRTLRSGAQHMNLL